MALNETRGRRNGDQVYLDSCSDVAVELEDAAGKEGTGVRQAAVDEWETSPSDELQLTREKIKPSPFFIKKDHALC